MLADTIEDVVRQGRFVKKGTRLPLSYVELHRTIDLEIPRKCNREDILEIAAYVCHDQENDPRLNCFSIIWDREYRWGAKYGILPWRYCITKVVVTYEMWPRKQT